LYIFKPISNLIFYLQK